MTKHIAEQLEIPAIATATPVAPPKPHYSYSALEMGKCGQKYYYKRIQKLTEEKTYNLAAGTILDTAFNAYYENNDHLQESHQQRLEYARAAVEHLLTENESWLTMPWSQKSGDVRSSPDNFIAWLFDHGAVELVCRHDRGPVEVQRKVSLELPHYFIDGYIDCIEQDTGTVIDVKAVTGWSEVTTLQYALRSQVPLYRMMLRDIEGRKTSGRYELLLCRKTPKLETIIDPDIDFLQEKLVRDFDAHHRMVSTKRFEKNPEQCFVYNKVCPFFAQCWPALAAQLTKE